MSQSESQVSLDPSPLIGPSNPFSIAKARRTHQQDQPKSGLREYLPYLDNHLPQSWRSPETALARTFKNVQRVMARNSREREDASLNVPVAPPPHERIAAYGFPPPLPPLPPLPPPAGAAGAAAAAGIAGMNCKTLESC